MSSRDDELEQLLRRSLDTNMKADELLNHKIIRQLREGGPVLGRRKRRFSVAVIAALAAVTISVSAFAAARYFSPNEVARHLGQPAIAQAFTGPEAVKLEESVVAGPYRFTLHGLVTGAGLSRFFENGEPLLNDRTYAVVSIAKEDGSPMTPVKDRTGEENSFFISPLVRGQAPWQLNAATMNGGYSEFVADGILYRLIETDGIEMFADRGLYMAVTSEPFIDNSVFAFDATTGDISIRADAKGINVLFDLPIDPAKADPAAAERYLEEQTGEKPEASATDKKEQREEDAIWPEQPQQEFQRIVAEGTLVPGSVQVLTTDKDGFVTYTFDGMKAPFRPGELFPDGKSGYSKQILLQSDQQSMSAVQFQMDDQGVITGRMYKVDR